MAIFIKPVPTLHGKAAERFNKAVVQNETIKRASVDFTKQMETARAILAKSKISE